MFEDSVLDLPVELSSLQVGLKQGRWARPGYQHRHREAWGGDSSHLLVSSPAPFILHAAQVCFLPYLLQCNFYFLFCGIIQLFDLEGTFRSPTSPTLLLT